MELTTEDDLLATEWMAEGAPNPVASVLVLLGKTMLSITSKATREVEP